MGEVLNGGSLGRGGCQQTIVSTIELKKSRRGGGGCKHTIVSNIELKKKKILILKFFIIIFRKIKSLKKKKTKGCKENYARYYFIISKLTL